MSFCLSFQDWHWPLYMVKKKKQKKKVLKNEVRSRLGISGSVQESLKRNGLARAVTVTMLPLRDSIEVTNTSASLAQTRLLALYEIFHEVLGHCPLLERSGK